MVKPPAPLPITPDSLRLPAPLKVTVKVLLVIPPVSDNVLLVFALMVVIAANVIALLTVVVLDPTNAPLPLTPVPLNVIAFVLLKVPLKFISKVAPLVTLVLAVLPKPAALLIRNVPTLTDVILA